MTKLDVATGEVKHGAFVGSLDNLQRAIGRMETLLEDVTGTNSEPVDSPTGKALEANSIDPLASFLVNGNTFVKNQSERLDQIREQLIEALF